MKESNIPLFEKQVDEYKNVTGSKLWLLN
jgi:hypothetical protein